MELFQCMNSQTTLILHVLSHADMYFTSVVSIKYSVSNQSKNQQYHPTLNMTLQSCVHDPADF